MKQCPQCGFLVDDKKTVCPDCQADVAGAPSISEPPYQPSKSVLIFNLVLVTIAGLLALFFVSWTAFLITAVCCFGIWSFIGLLALMNLFQEDGGGLVALLSAASMLIIIQIVVYRGCGYLFWK